MPVVVTSPGQNPNLKLEACGFGGASPVQAVAVLVVPIDVCVDDPTVCVDVPVDIVLVPDPDPAVLDVADELWQYAFAKFVATRTSSASLRMDWPMLSQR